jgi:multicomponent Na+:H+ antiporter subunit G
VTVSDALAGALVVIALLSLFVCAVGVVLAHDAFERLHFSGAVSTIPPVAVALAVLLGRGAGQLAVKAALVAIVVLVTGPVLTHATARAARLRQEDES